MTRNQFSAIIACILFEGVCIIAILNINIGGWLLHLFNAAVISLLLFLFIIRVIDVEKDFQKQEKEHGRDNSASS